MTARVPSLTPKVVLKVLKAYGFIEDHVTGSHYILFHPETKRRVTVAFHTRDLPRGTLMAIIKASGIDLNEFYAS